MVIHPPGIDTQDMQNTINPLLAFITSRQRGGMVGYLIAIALIGASLLLRLAIAPVAEGSPFLTFYSAVTLAALFGGARPGLFALLICSVLADYMFIPPHNSFEISKLYPAFWSNAVFWVEELMVIVVIEGMYIHRGNEAAAMSELRTEQARLQLMVDNVAGFATLLLDEAGRISSWNKGAKSLYGYAAEEVLGKSHEMFFRPEDVLAGTPHKLLKQAQQKEGFESEGWRVCKDGSLFFASIVTSPLIDENGQVTGFVKVSRDISDRYRYEQRLKTIIQSAPVPLIMSNARGEILLMNTQAENLFQYTQQELQGKSIEILLPSQYRDAHRHHRTSFMEAPVSRQMNTGTTLFGLRKNGGEFPVEVGLGAIQDQDEYLVLATCADLSDRKLAEAQLVEARIKSDEANNIKSEFLANMSHEIRTPMNAIIGLTRLTLDSGLNAKQRDHLQKVFKSSRALLGILDDILDYSKIEAGKLNLEYIEFSLEEVFENISELFSARIAEKGLELFIDFDRKINCQLIGDALRLTQVITNFVSNAIKFTEQGGIHLKVEWLRQDEEHLTLRFVVKDTGIGIDKLQSEQLFTAFNQADSSITRKYGGTGLGLTIARRLVNMMGGEISLTSVPGKGSTFAFSATFARGATHEVSLPHALKSMRALLVDDQETALNVLEHYLQTWKFDVTGTTSAEDALDLLARAERDGCPYEILLIDWRMPGVDGLELMRRMEIQVKQGQLQCLPVIIMVTAHDRGTLLGEAGATSIDEVLLKPVTPSSLFNTLLRIQQPALSRQIARPVTGVDLYQLAAPIRGARILLVEDNDINQEVAAGFLTNAGLRVTLANNGALAVERVQQEIFDAILMDVQMPVMDGLAACRLIRAMPAFGTLPIFALSAAAMTQDIEACLQAGMDGHISKPFEPEQLITTLIQGIRREGYRADSVHEATVPVVAAVDDSAMRLEGFDLAGALARMGNSRALLDKLLLRFATDYASSPELLKQLLHDNQPDKAAHLLHRLKGVAATLGATKLAEIIRQLEGEVASGTAVISVNLFARHLTKAVLCIQQHVQPAFYPQVPQYDAERVDAELAILAQYLKSNELPENKALSALLASLSGHVSPQWMAELEGHIDNFDFAAGRATLVKVIAARSNN